MVSPPLILSGTWFAGNSCRNGAKESLQREAGKQKGRMNLIMETGSKEGETLVGAVIAESKYQLLQFYFFFPQINWN